MKEWPCPTTPAACPPCDDNPVLNLTVADLDPVTYVGGGWGSPIPRLGDSFFAKDCFNTWVYSTISQEDADRKAQLKADLCVDDFVNTIQTCVVTCDDETTQFYTMLAGLYAGSTQAEADAKAMADACVVANSYCIPATKKWWSAEQTCSVTCEDGTVSSYTLPAGSIVSLLSQADADERANTFACEMVPTLCTPVSGLYWNTEQSCVFTCPDGSQVTHTIPAGTVSAWNQTDADAAAHDLACLLAPYDCDPNAPRYYNAAQTCAQTCPDGTVITKTVEAHYLFSTVSQADADKIAYDFACELALLECPPQDIWYYNTEQTATTTCPDGTVLTYIVLPGQYQGRTQAEVDALALTLAKGMVDPQFCDSPHFWNTEQSCIGLCGSTVTIPAGFVWALSQENADLLARLYACNQTSQICRVLPIGGRIGNDPKTSVHACGYGQAFQYTLPANVFFATTKARANQMAQVQADYLAGQRYICLDDLDVTSACADASYTGNIVATGPGLSVFPYTDYWELVSGTLPPGLTFNGGFQSGGHTTITGTPTTAGSYTFTVKVTAHGGSYMTNTYSISIRGISTASPLSSATVGLVYSVQLTQTGYTNPVFTVSSGALPVGLNLSLSGLISGIPTTSGLSAFEISVDEAP
jgi:hypothetical protein